MRPLAMITGGTRGVGAGIAEEFVKDGYNVILGYRANVDAAETFKEYLFSIFNYYSIPQCANQKSNKVERYSKTKCAG